MEFGKFIGINLKFDIICKDKGAFRKKKKKHKSIPTNIFYHPFIIQLNFNINTFLLNIWLLYIVIYPLHTKCYQAKI